MIQPLPTSQDEIEKAKNQNILDVFRLAGVQFEKKANRYVAHCPFHQDNTPSLIIYTNTNSWACFSAKCINPRGARLNGGNAFDFIWQLHNCKVGDALRWFDDNFLLQKQIKKVDKPQQKQGQKITIENDDLIYWHSLMDSLNKRQWFYSRGFKDRIIDAEFWGWDGMSYILPIWEGEPRNSFCLAVKRRFLDKSKPKYVKYGDKRPAIWGKWYAQGVPEILVFAGELDAARAIQDGYPAFSLVDGARGFNSLKANWPDSLFPDAKNLTIIFDKKEECLAGQLATIWERIKGKFTARIIHYPIDFNGKDYCDWRDNGRQPEDLINYARLT